MTSETPQTPFFGWKAVWGAFALAVFGWGLGFYGPPIYLQTVRETRGWSIGLVSAAVTLHFLVGALVVANLPALYRRFGLPVVTKVGAITLGFGLVGWSLAVQPWQLFVATLLSGAGWVAMGAAAVNAIVAPWFIQGRPKALSTAYNGASIGGIVFAPLWVLAIGSVGFTTAAILISTVMVVTIWLLSDRVFAHSPASLGQAADNGILPTGQAATKLHPALPGSALWKSLQFRTLAAGMALGLFAQIGLLAHLFSLIVPVVGATAAGLMMAAATASAIAGRTVFGWLLPPTADRRLAVCLSFSIQIVGALLLYAAISDNVAVLFAGILLFGFGIGNATSFPPLIAQVEFAKEDASRVVPLIVAMGQATYAFAPMAFGVLRELPALLPNVFRAGDSLVYLGAAAVQILAILSFLAGRRRFA